MILDARKYDGKMGCILFYIFWPEVFPKFLLVTVKSPGIFLQYVRESMTQSCTILTAKGIGESKRKS
jgi:hypothetical protein